MRNRKRQPADVKDEIIDDAIQDLASQLRAASMHENMQVELANWYMSTVSRAVLLHGTRQNSVSLEDIRNVLPSSIVISNSYSRRNRTVAHGYLFKMHSYY